VEYTELPTRVGMIWQSKARRVEVQVLDILWLHLFQLRNYCKNWD